MISKLLNSLKKEIIIKIICYLYVLLFVYAATSKLLDIETFQVQLGQSPLLSAFADWVSWGVIVTELFVSGLLLYDKTRRIGLYFAFALMTMFTTYIVIILNFSSFIPCSCGGILEKLGWSEHLIFNIGFIILSLIALILIKGNNTFSNKTKSFIIIIVISFLTSIMLVTILYLLSEDKIHRNNSFIRRYPPHPVTTIKGLNIKYNSYYIAGIADGRIYLGNTSAPAHLISVDTTLSDVKTHNIELNNEHKIELFSPQIRILSPYIYLIDGTSSVIFKGSLSDFKTELYWRGNNNNVLISQIEVISPTKFVFRGIDQLNNQNIIGKIDLEKQDNITISNQLIQKQKDGIFDTDGMLRYNSNINQFIYTYYYRNEFITADSNLNLDYHGRTIDTVKNAVIKIASKNSGQVRTLAQEPLIVNHQSYSSGKYLFIKSDRLGKYEPEEMLKDASIIDVYNLKNQTYEFSFYLYDYADEKIKNFQIYKNLLIGLSEHHIVLYRLQPFYFDLTY
jgi:uncharacterized membrane protein YphA (DoxX/SURF4 family)